MITSGEPAPVRRRFTLHGLAVSTVIAAAACGGARDGHETVTIALASSPSASQPVVRVEGLSERELRALSGAGLDADGWQQVLRVTVADGPSDQPPVIGRYAVTPTALEFTPMFPFDPGRTYAVRFDRARVPGLGTGDVVQTTVALAAPARGPSTRVTRVYPSSGTWPENILRLYIEFSGPMSRTGAVEFVRLVDDAGREVVDPFLPMDLDLWNQDHTRCTVFFDPGRVKTGLVPHEELGRALEPGRSYTIEISANWRDQHGQPLAEPYRQAFTVGPADLGVVTPAAWTIAAPASGTRDALVVTLHDSLDRGLLQRTIGVRRAGVAAYLEGDVTVGEGERQWRFVPARPWSAGAYDLTVLSILEDAAGNRVGRLFEVDRFDRIDEQATPEESRRPFTVR